MWLKTRMFLLVALLFGILYGVIAGVGAWMGAGGALTYLILAFGFLGIQYLIGRSIIGWAMSRIIWLPPCMNWSIVMLDLRGEGN